MDRVRQMHDNTENLKDKSNNLLLILKKLKLSDFCYSNVRNFISAFKHITVLNLSRTSLEELPEGIEHLYNLQSLDASCNKLSTLPKNIHTLHQLKYLNISLNNFLNVPDVLYYGLRQVEILDLSFNKISEFNDVPSCSGNIFVLKMSYNNLHIIPTWIFFDFCSLKVLEINNNPFYSHLHPTLTFFKSRITDSLSVLDLQNCNYKSDIITLLIHFHKLEVLKIGNTHNSKNRNYCGNIAMTIVRNHESLKSLNIQNTKICTLPYNFGDCFKCIQYLNLCHNMLPWLPDSFCTLISLKILFLTSNEILFLPKDIGQLVDLQQIHLSCNKLRGLPESFKELRKLEFVDLFDNKIENFDISILNNEHLNGIDLELNSVKLKTNNSFDVTPMKEKYEVLKNCLRRKFNYIDKRKDVQVTIPRQFLDDEVFYSQKSKEYREDAGDVCDELHVTAIGPNNTFSTETDSGAVTRMQQVIQFDEQWDDDNEVQEKYDFFVPQVEVFNKKSMSEHTSIGEISLMNNYCPASTHIKSPLKPQELQKTDFDVVEGQFDSD